MRPKVSIVIPVGPKHTTVLTDALNSVENQTFEDWECIVVNDSSASLDLDGFPFVRLIETTGSQGAGFARNAGVRNTKGQLFTCLDADDILLPDFLAVTVGTWQQSGKWVYTDYFIEKDSGVPEMRRAPDWDLQTLWRSGLSVVTCLYPKVAWEEVGGFNEQCAHEDWEFHLQLAAKGYEGVRVERPLMTYRKWLSVRSREQSRAWTAVVLQKKYPLGSLVAACSGPLLEEPLWPVLVYTGKSVREVIISCTNMNYKVDVNNRVLSVHPDDVPYVLATKAFRLAEPNELKAPDNYDMNVGLGLAHSI